MTAAQEQHSTLLALSALAALAVCMGIGRFAFTPLLPMMQADAGLTLAFGGWLASANYLGYLAGALAAGALPGKTSTQLKAGLGLVVVSTALMGLTQNGWGWLALRFVAGLASAIGLVATTTLCLTRLNAAGAARKAGIMFAGVGAGVALAGLICMGLVVAGISSASSWLVMGATALLGMAAARRLWTADHAPSPRASAPVQRSGAPANAPEAATSHDAQTHARPVPTPGGRFRLIFCYGCFGFGYILPATFLPAQARQLVTDPQVFGLAWPLFGLAAMLSTLLVSYRAGGRSRRHVWIAAQLVMAVGVLLPALWQSISAIVLAALCVGGTFMVMTMMGMQEAQAMGGAQPRRLVAAVTAAFAAGQLAGPVVFSLLHDYLDVSLDGALILAGLVLLSSSVLLVRPFSPAR
ncbi:YbfB/YjiJ family MFS transporter [Paracandidimonas lactea]|uniref:YbfB/YjiJ family MFS transporter n=1 Tax=Paracandidimonas lactea TaxID=2895524 RepID=UPI001F43E59D|nr:YbfB/YjiJ family MFS transporter [Paracandidimonas lactea]